MLALTLRHDNYRLTSCSSSLTRVFCQSVFNGYEIFERFGHLASGDGQVAGVEKVADPVVVLKKSLWRENRRRSFSETSYSFRHKLYDLFLSQFVTWKHLQLYCSSPVRTEVRVTASVL